MPLATHDGHYGPSNGIAAIEGRMLVLEVVAMTSLALVLDTSDDENAKIGRGVLYLIREAVESKCEEAGLTDEAASAAQAYVEELLNTAMGSLYPDRN